MKQLSLILIPLILVGAFLASCKQEKTAVQEEILAKVADKTISANEFIRRAEYTIRPNYCSGDNYIHRKIVLNSLIAEKLLALEAGDDNALTHNHEFNQYITGRKEQAMRQWLFYEVAVKPVKLDTGEINRTYRLAGRVYDVSYLNAPDEQTAQKISELLGKGIPFDSLAKNLNPKKRIPRREINFEAEEPDAVNAALFNENIRKGEIVGPVKVDRDNFVFLKVNGWRTQVAMTERQQRDRLSLVKDKLTERHALVNYEKFISKIMHGKTLEFNEPVFRKLVTILGPEYYKTPKEKKEQFNKKFWNKDNDLMIRDDAQAELAKIADQPFFTIDGRTWTVADFQDEILRHPLIFRKKKFPKNKFARQFKLAVVDMIRDHYLTQEAYKRGYDKVPQVVRNVNMWRDNLLALYQKKQYLDFVGAKGKKTNELIREYLDPYVAKLRQKYADQIFINTDVFEKIKLTRIPMFALQPNQAFPVVVPSFPQLTMHNKLDYGKKLIPESDSENIVSKTEK